LRSHAGEPVTSRRRRPLRALAPIGLLGVLALAGCGSQASRLDNRIDGRRLTVDVSVPLQGASRVQGEAVRNGAQMALSAIHGRIGRYRVTMRTLDDATIASDKWNPGQTELDANVAIADRETIGYVGDLDSGASAISIPLLNRFAIAQVSPASTAVGLTSASLGANPGEPEKYYPTGIRTFARVVPSDAVEASAQVQLERSDRCRKVFVLDDGEVDGFDAAQSFGDAAQAAALDVVANQIYDITAMNYTAEAQKVKSSGADCILISAITDDHAVELTEALAAAMPNARIFGTAGLAESTYTDPAQGGIPLALDSRIQLTSPALGASLYPPSGRRFLARYKALYGATEPDAIFGYEAMGLLLSAIDRATGHGHRDAVRSLVARALLSTHDRAGAIGTYSIEPDGNPTLDRYGIYRIAEGELQFSRAAEG
jgi:branched-chain amino acid transport system substrate-binding protein